jgi:hypothetical protein
MGQLLGLNFRVAAPSWFSEGAEVLIFRSDCGEWDVIRWRVAQHLW